MGFIDQFGLVNVPPRCFNGPGTCSGGGTGAGTDDLVLYKFPGGNRPLMPMDLYGLDILMDKIRENNLNDQYNLPLPSSPNLPPVVPQEPVIQVPTPEVSPDHKRPPCQN